MAPVDDTKRVYFCPLSLIEGISCPAQVERVHKEVTVLKEHSHPPEMTHSHRQQLKSFGIKVKKKKGRKSSRTEEVDSLAEEGSPEKRFKVAPELLEEAKKAKKVTYNCWNQRGEPVELSGYMVTSIDLGPDPRTNGHTENGSESGRTARAKRRAS